MPLDEVRALGQPTRLENGQRVSALRFADERVMALTMLASPGLWTGAYCHLQKSTRISQRRR
jgi:hypothetical protein